MALKAIQRLVSNGTDHPVTNQPVYYASTQSDAIAAAQSGTGNQALGATPPDPDVWPALYKFDNDPNFSGIPNPVPIWGSSTAAGQTYWFATKSNNFTVSGPGGPSVFINLTTFCDNAIEAQYFIYSTATTTPVVTGTLLTDGVFDPTAGTTSDVYPPYNWQKVRFFSNLESLEAETATGGVTAETSYYIVFTFHGINYNVLYGPNPAGLAFVADVYGNTAGGGNGGGTAVLG